MTVDGLSAVCTLRSGSDNRYDLVFFFNDTATTEIYSLSLHDALPISHCRPDDARARRQARSAPRRCSRAREERRSPDTCGAYALFFVFVMAGRSEEHTSELQSPDHLVCRLLLEQKK